VDGFGSDATAAFLERNGLSLLIRSHECVPEGYKVLHNEQCVTVFSASNYCGRARNKGAVVRFEDPTNMTPLYEQYMATSSSGGAGPRSAGAAKEYAAPPVKAATCTAADAVAVTPVEDIAAQGIPPSSEC
jgi:hypothetical protein